MFNSSGHFARGHLSLYIAHGICPRGRKRESSSKNIRNAALAATSWKFGHRLTSSASWFFRTLNFLVAGGPGADCRGFAWRQDWGGSGSNGRVVICGVVPVLKSKTFVSRQDMNVFRQMPKAFGLYCVMVCHTLARYFFRTCQCFTMFIHLLFSHFLNTDYCTWLYSIYEYLLFITFPAL